MVVFWVALGGAIGAVARYGFSIWSFKVFGAEFPWHTLLVNISGCFLMGVITELMALKFNVGLETRAFLTTGILGGFTTFSAFALDFAVLAERREFMSAGAYIMASVGLSIMALFAALYLVRAVASS